MSMGAKDTISAVAAPKESNDTPSGSGKPVTQRSVRGPVWRRRASAVGIRAFSVAMLAVAWQIVALLVPSTTVPSPEASYTEFVDIATSGALLDNFGATMMRVVGSFFLALLVGVCVGTVMGLSRRAERVLDVWVMVGLTIPGLVYIIVSFLWFGLTEYAAIVAIAWTTFPAISVNVWSGVKAIDQKLVDMARIFGAPQGRRLFSVIMPQIMPYVMGATRYGFGIAWKITVFVELIGMSSGVGYQLNYEFQVFNMPGVFAWTVFFTIVMLIIEIGIFKPLEQWMFRWRPELHG